MEARRFMIEGRLCTYKITGPETTKPPNFGGFEKFIKLTSVA